MDATASPLACTVIISGSGAGSGDGSGAGRGEGAGTGSSISILATGSARMSSRGMSSKCRAEIFGGFQSDWEYSFNAVYKKSIQLMY